MRYSYQTNKTLCYTQGRTVFLLAEGPGLYPGSTKRLVIPSSGGTTDVGSNLFDVRYLLMIPVLITFRKAKFRTRKVRLSD